MAREAKEETGLDVKIVRSGPLIEFIDEYGRAVAVPFVIESTSGKVVVTEHSEYLWIEPKDVVKYHAVPDMTMALDAFGFTKRRRAPRRTS